MRFTDFFRVLVVSVGAFLAIDSGHRCWSDDSDRQLTAIGHLIEQLGADSYATRLRAKEKLQRIGLEAFDELHLAQFHADSEIAMAARYLVNRLSVSWSKESDPPEVREALDEYGAQDEDDRSTRIDMLAEFPERLGLAALVRLTRFETSLRLSRRAALALMQQKMSPDLESRQRRSEQILEILGDNDRQAAEWLRVYAEDLSSGGYSADRWHQLITTQRQQIDSAATQQSTRPSVLELVRVSATRAAAAGQVDEALRLASDNLDLIAPTTRHLIEACSWAIDNNLHPFVLELQQQHAEMFNKQPVLLYGAAEANKLAGEDAQANALAERALSINPLPTNEAERAKMQPKEIEEAAQSHREIGKKLEERGLFHWAEREFRQIIDAMEIDSLPAAFARQDLALMLSELERNQDVIDVLKPLNDRTEKDEKLRQQLNASLFNIERLRSDVRYHQALLLIEDNKPEESKPLLVQAFHMNPTNIDILIRMYRMDGDESWRAMVQKDLDRTVRRCEVEVRQARNEARQRGRIGDWFLAHKLNQYAWLVSNTEGNYDKALEFSLESLDIETDGAKLDTCARCYFATGDIPNAIRMQKRALKLMPHSPPLLRQLGEFEQALAKQESLSSGAADASDATTVPKP